MSLLPTVSGVDAVRQPGGPQAWLQGGGGLHGAGRGGAGGAAVHFFTLEGEGLVDQVGLGSRRHPEDGVWVGQGDPGTGHGEQAPEHRLEELQPSVKDRAPCEEGVR